jgi:signal transduction histidine kinase
MPSKAIVVRRAAVGTVGLMLGGLMAIAEMLFLVASTPIYAVAPVTRPGITTAVRTFVALDRRRIVTFLDFDDLLCVVPDWRRAHSYLTRRVIVGLVGLGIVALMAFGLVSTVIMVGQVLAGRPVGGGDQTNGNWSQLIVVVLFGMLLLFVAVWGLIGVAVLERTLAQQYLGPTEEQRLRQRVSELSTTRAGVVEAVNDERRRIERDLHDGVQQRLVALGLLLGRARRASEPDRVEELLRQAHEESQQTLRDLREVTWRVYPTALDAGGLHTALEGVAERSSVPVRLRYGLVWRPDLATETVAYFVASEAVTNALKHGNPTMIDIEVTHHETAIAVAVCDNGTGGADASGSGLSGLASRVAAADGTFMVDSPPGGPTVIVARLPADPARVDEVSTMDHRM